MSQKNIIIIAVGIFLVVFFIVALIVFGRKEKVVTYNLDLDVWGVFDNTSDYNTIFDAYAKAHPFVGDVTYRKFVVDTYKKELLNALAAGNGPDIFMIHNTWLPEFEDKIVPAPVYIIDEQMFRTDLVDVAALDGMVESEVYALPLSVDSLALYYNKDLFNAVGITSPPETWGEFDQAVKTLTRLDDESNQIIQSAVALGTIENVNRATDILTVLMMQGGAEMSQGTQATFDDSATIGGQTRTPGKRAVQYYTQFARGGSEVYTWNPAQHYSLDAFAAGQTAMTINYSWHFDTLKAKNEKLNLAVAPLPQIDTSTTGNHVNYANYWMFVVTKNKEEQSADSVAKDTIPVNSAMRIHEAWQFLRSIALPDHDGDSSAHTATLQNASTGKAYGVAFPFDLTQTYLEETGKPAARKDLIREQLTDIKLSPFASGNLIARSWYHPNAEAVERVLADIITQINTGAATVDDALKLGAQRATQLMQ